MRHRYGIVIAAVLFALAAPAATSAAVQEEPPPEAEETAGQALRVFLDCERFTCDFDHFRREVDFIDYVRDRTVADVHVLVTTESTGAGGTSYTLAFLGLDELEGVGDTLVYASRPDETDAETRDGLVQTFTLGLVRHIARTPAGRLLDISYRGGEVVGGDAQQGPDDDPWNLWVFRIRLGGEFEGESRQSDQQLDASVSANRTTEASKVTLRANGDWQRQSFELSDGDEIESTTRDFDVFGRVVWSLSDHWSLGAQGSATAATRLNQDLTLRASPALEYNIFPYSESTRRQITFLYQVGVASFDYEEETLFGRTSETKVEHSLDISGEFQQPWGEFNVSAEASSFLDDFSAHRLDLFSRFEIRLFRGVSFDVQGNIARVKNQLYIPREDLTDEDILLERRRLGTDWEYSIEFGVSFTFGSLFNNVVNPRIDTRGGGRFRF